MQVRPFFYLLVFSFLCVQTSRAQQYLLARYTPKDGLINNRARFLYQDSKGRLYISTFGGLSVYDGSRFTNYTTENGLAASLVNDIVEMGEDSLWIIPNGPALHCMVRGVLHNIQTADNFYPVINQLVKCRDGYSYAIADEGLFRFEKNRFIKVRMIDSSGKEIDRNLIHAIEWNRQLLILTDPYMDSYPGHASLLAYDLDTRKLLTAAKPTAFYSLLRTSSNDVLLATGEGVRKIDTNALRQHTIRLLPMPAPYQAANTFLCKYMYFDNTRNLWLSSGKEIIRIDREGDSLSFNTLNGLPAGTDNSIFQDRENNIWFTYEQNGIAKIINAQVQFYGQPQPGFTVSDLSAGSSGDSLWLYDYLQNNLLLQTGKTQKIIHGVGPIPAMSHFIIGKDAYMLCSDKIYAIQFLPGQRFCVKLLYKDTALIDRNVCFDREGNLILVSGKLTVVSPGRVSQYTLPYLADQVAIDKYNRIWTITRANQLCVFADTTAIPSDHWRPSPSDPWRPSALGDRPTPARPISATPLAISSSPLKLLATWSKEQPVVGARSITVDNKGRIWIGTRDHGLYCLFFDSLRLLSWQQLTIKNGLTENFVNYLFCDPDNTVWACTPTGLNKIRIDNDHFTVENITPGNDINPGIYKIALSRNGTHWALIKGGYMKITPMEEEKNDYRPRILFSQVLVGNQPVTDPVHNTLALPYDRNSLSFYIGVPTFTDENQTRFTYRLQGSIDPQWSAPSTQSAVNFVNLPPGHYTLEVRARFLTGRFPEETAAYPFVIRPPWWQTAWFRIFLVLGLAGLIVWGIRNYTRRRLEMQRTVLERQQAIEKERTRIATDMHDDLGAGLSRIKFLSETIGIKRQRQLPIDDEINGIREYSHDMIDKMGEIVWALNERNDSLSDLLSYTRSYAAEYLMQAGIKCKVVTPEEFPSRFVSGEFRRNVYLTIKETLHNIVKHARADNVCIRMEITPTLVITIQDDGVGFDTDRIRPFSNGLHNMQRRIKDIGGTLVFLPGIGTTVRLSVPI